MAIPIKTTRGAKLRAILHGISYFFSRTECITQTVVERQVNATFNEYPRHKRQVRYLRQPFTDPHAEQRRPFLRA